MMNLAEYRRSTTHLADFLPWAALVNEGVVLNKDGSFQCTAKCCGLSSIVPPRRSSSAKASGKPIFAHYLRRRSRNDNTRCTHASGRSHIGFCARQAMLK